MKDYYRARAAVYDRVYRYPERQQELRFLEKYIAGRFEGREVLEVAAGTGYWTQFIAPVAKSILATDASAEVLALLQQRPETEGVICRQQDAYALHENGQNFDAGFAGLWISHVPKQAQRRFIQSFHQCLKPGARVLLLDNSIAQCERLPLSHTDEFGNSYQDRSLDDGSVYRVLKNFPTEAELHELVGVDAQDRRYSRLEHFWLFEYRLKAAV